MAGSWDQASPRVLVLPSGRCVRGRGLRDGHPTQEPAPDWGLYLTGRPPAPPPWSWRWLRWPDFRLPVDRDDARDAFVEAWRRSGEQRVEVACAGGRGRTGTAMACLAVLDGVPSGDAVRYVRDHYDPRAVETPWQRRYVVRFQAL